MKRCAERRTRNAGSPLTPPLSREGRGKSPTHVVRRTPNCDAFTLLEVMIAVAILAMVLISLMGLKSRSVQDVALAEHMTTATLLARRTMTEAVLKRPLSLSEESGEYPEEEYAGYSWTKIVAPTPLPAFLEVRIAVSWREDDREEMVELVSYE